MSFALQICLAWTFPFDFQHELRYLITYIIFVRPSSAHVHRLWSVVCGAHGIICAVRICKCGLRVFGHFISLRIRVPNEHMSFQSRGSDGHSLSFRPHEYYLGLMLRWLCFRLRRTLWIYCCFLRPPQANDFVWVLESVTHCLQHHQFWFVDGPRRRLEREGLSARAKERDIEELSESCENRGQDDERLRAHAGDVKRRL